MSDSFATHVAHQVPLSLGFPSQEYWSGLPFPLPGDLPNPGTEPMSPALAGGFLTTEPPGKPSFTCAGTLKLGRVHADHVYNESLCCGCHIIPFVFANKAMGRL